MLGTQRKTGVLCKVQREPSCGSRWEREPESGRRWKEKTGVGGHGEGAAGTDATSGSLQKAGLQQGWMLTALSGALSRDSLRGRFLRTLSKATFYDIFAGDLSEDSFQGSFKGRYLGLSFWGTFQGCFSGTLARVKSKMLKTSNNVHNLFASWNKVLVLDSIKQPKGCSKPLCGRMGG